MNSPRRYPDPEEMPHPGTCGVGEWLEDVEAGRTPRGAPEGCSPYGRSLLSWDEEWLDRLDARQRGLDLGMHCIVYQAWAADLAGWIGRRRVLEVMSGRGWLAQALAENGTSIIATDDFSWKEREKWSETLVPVLEMDATVAVQEHPDAEILLCAWPYVDDAFSRACEAWGPGRPIAYVGYGMGGCCADDAFFHGFVEDGPVIELLTWPGIHDGIHTGRWSCL